MSLRWLVVHEAAADFLVATELADRVLVQEIDWLEPNALDWQRAWIDSDPPTIPLRWTSIAGRARDLGIRVRGHFNNERGLPDARAARRALLYMKSQCDPVDAVALIRDADDQPERREGLEQARAHVSGWPWPVVIGVANVERECWLIGGFEPESDLERQRLKVEREHLGFDPRTHSHELTACKDDTAKKSPKRVLAVLTGGDRDREQKCWRETSLAVLEQRGDGNGLAKFFQEIRVLLVPMIGGRP